MLKIRLGNITIKIDFSFFATLAIIILLDKSGCAVLSLVASVCHEAGHLLVLLIENNKPQSIIFSGGGFKIIRCKGKPSIAVLFAGSAMNFFLAFIFFLVSDLTSVFPILFSCANFFIGIFNLLPLKNLDGGQIVAHAAERMLRPKGVYIAVSAAQIAGVIAIIAVMLTAICNNVFNPSFFIVLIYIFCLDILVEL